MADEVVVFDLEFIGRRLLRRRLLYLGRCRNLSQVQIYNLAVEALLSPPERLASIGETVEEWIAAQEREIERRLLDE